MSKGVALNDAFYLTKRAIRKCKTLDEALDELTDIGLGTDSREVFDFTERLRGFLCEKDRRNVGKNSDVPRGRPQRQDASEFQKKAGRDEMDGGK